MLPENSPSRRIACQRAVSRLLSAVLDSGEGKLYSLDLRSGIRMFLTKKVIAPGGRPSSKTWAAESALSHVFPAGTSSASSAIARWVGRARGVANTATPVGRGSSAERRRSCAAAAGAFSARDASNLGRLEFPERERELVQRRSVRQVLEVTAVARSPRIIATFAHASRTAVPPEGAPAGWGRARFPDGVSVSVAGGVPEGGAASAD